MNILSFKLVFLYLFFDSAAGQGDGCRDILYGRTGIIRNADAGSREGISSSRSRATVSSSRHSFGYRSDLRLEVAGGEVPMCLELTRREENARVLPCDCGRQGQVFYFLRVGGLGRNEYIIYNPQTGNVLENDDGEVKVDDFDKVADGDIGDGHVWQVTSRGFFDGIYSSM